MTRKLSRDLILITYKGNLMILTDKDNETKKTIQKRQFDISKDISKKINNTTETRHPQYVTIKSKDIIDLLDFESNMIPSLKNLVNTITGFSLKNINL